MTHMGNDLVAIARWSITGELPSSDEFREMSNTNTGLPVVVFDDDEQARTIDVLIGEEAVQAGAISPRALNEVLASLEWVDATGGPVLSEASGIPGNGVVVYYAEPDGRDRLAVLYQARKFRLAMRGTVQVQLLLHAASDPLPASVESIRAQRALGTWVIPTAR